MINGTSIVIVRAGKIHVQDYRCTDCGKLLFRAHIPAVAGIYFEMRCRWCGHIFTLESTETLEADNVEPESGISIAIASHLGADERAVLPDAGSSG